MDATSAAFSGSGNNVEVIDDQIHYTPPQDYFGTDSFTYQIADVNNPSSVSTGNVVVTVTPIDDQPVFIGRDGVVGYQPATDDLSFIESKEIVQSFEYDLNEWFRELDGEPLNFTVESSDPGAVEAVIDDDGILETYAAPFSPIIIMFVVLFVVVVLTPVVIVPSCADDNQAHRRKDIVQRCRIAT